jgi:hypothetical protein
MASILLRDVQLPPRDGAQFGGCGTDCDGRFRGVNRIWLLNVKDNVSVESALLQSVIGA